MIKYPLAEAMRPKTLEEIAGEDHLVGKGGWITKIIQKGHPLSVLLWGPPGSGKTTIARLYAKAFKARLVTLSAVSGGVSDLKKWIKDVKEHPLFQEQLIVFVDEIHRFNKAQQDLFLPYIEDGSVILIGATTENPSFSINNALLSRLRVLTVKHLDAAALNQILIRFENKIQKLYLTEEAREALIQLAQGDGRYLLNMVENLQEASENESIDLKTLSHLIQKRAALYDRNQDGHYNLISALHKSVRGSDPDAALYWLARMLEGGEDPQYLARRIMRMAIEDIGLADPDALTVALNAWKVFDQLGSPEGELAFAEAIVYLALAPKSNAVYIAFKHAQELSRSTSHLNPPKTILNAPTSLMKKIGYGEDYQYDHDVQDGFSGQNYFPDELQRTVFYHPVERGFEREMKKRVEFFEKLREKRKKE